MKKWRYLFCIKTKFNGQKKTAKICLNSQNFLTIKIWNFCISLVVWMCAIWTFHRILKSKRKKNFIAWRNFVLILFTFIHCRRRKKLSLFSKCLTQTDIPSHGKIIRDFLRLLFFKDFFFRFFSRLFIVVFLDKR